MSSSGHKLNSSDFCARLPILEAAWERESLSPMQLLYRGVVEGLTAETDDPGQAAGDHVLSLAVSRPIETDQSDLLGLAEHLAALADMIVWILRTAGPWTRPESVKVGNHLWTPECFTGPNGTLRRVVLVDRWTDERALAESFDWRTLEGTVYGLPMTILAVVLGASRDGRRHGPLSKGWLHPVAQTLRFRKRDGSGFDGNWQPVYRESFKGTREDWIDAMTEDGVCEEAVRVEEIAPSANRAQILALAESKLAQIASGEMPEPQLSRCFDPIRKCPFSSCCPYFKEPSEKLGFLPSPAH